MKTPAMLAAGALCAIGATACCFAPLLLVMLGFRGAWAARQRTAWWIVAAIIALMAAFPLFASYFY